MTRLSIISPFLCLFAANAIGQELPGESLGLIPEAPQIATKPKSKSAPPPKKKSSTEQESDDLQSRIRYREAKTKAMQDPKVQLEWDRAQTAKTDPEKRDALKGYYRLLCDRMVRIDSSVKPRVESLRKSLAWHLDPDARQRVKLVKPANELDADERDTQIR